MRRFALIPGESLLGFWGAFENDAGDATTPKPYPRVTPSRVGPVLLPFRCPHCDVMSPDLACGSTREHYHAKGAARDWYWCPKCHKRFTLNLDGMPLPEELPAGALVAPSKVERGKEVTMQDGEVDAGGDLHLLGVD